MFRVRVLSTSTLYDAQVYSPLLNESGLYLNAAYFWFRRNLSGKFKISQKCSMSVICHKLLMSTIWIIFAVQLNVSHCKILLVVIILLMHSFLCFIINVTSVFFFCVQFATVFKARDLFNDGNIVAVKKVNMHYLFEANSVYSVCIL